MQASNTLNVPNNDGLRGKVIQYITTGPLGITLDESRGSEELITNLVHLLTDFYKETKEKVPTKYIFEHLVSPFFGIYSKPPYKSIHNNLQNNESKLHLLNKIVETTMHLSNEGISLLSIIKIIKESFSKIAAKQIDISYNREQHIRGWSSKDLSPTRIDKFIIPVEETNPYKDFMQMQMNMRRLRNISNHRTLHAKRDNGHDLTRIPISMFHPQGNIASFLGNSNTRNRFTKKSLPKSSDRKRKHSANNINKSRKINYRSSKYRKKNSSNNTKTVNS